MNAVAFARWCASWFSSEISNRAPLYNGRTPCSRILDPYTTARCIVVVQEWYESAPVCSDNTKLGFRNRKSYCFWTLSHPSFSVSSSIFSRPYAILTRCICMKCRTCHFCMRQEKRHNHPSCQHSCRRQIIDGHIHWQEDIVHWNNTSRRIPHRLFAKSNLTKSACVMLLLIIS